MGMFTNYIAEKQKVGSGPLTKGVEQPAPGTPDQTNPAEAPAASPGAFKDYLQSKGSTSQMTPAEKGPVEAAVDTALPYAETYGQGAGLGYGTAANAGMQAGLGAVDQAVSGSNNFGDQSSPDSNIITRTVDAISNISKNYGRAKKEVQSDIDKVRASHPVSSALLEIAGSVPSSFVGGSALKDAGMASSAARSSLLAGTYGYGSSKNEGVSAIGDAAKSAALGYGLEKGVQVAGNLLSTLKNVPFEDYLAGEYADYTKPIVSIAKASVKETPYGLDFKPKLGDAFSIGKDMKAVLTDPNVQAQVTSEFNAQPHIVQDIIDQTKSRLGETWKPIIAEHGDVAMKSDTLLNKAFETAKNVSVSGDDVAEKLQGALFQKIQGIGEAMRPADAISGMGGETTLKQLTEAQEALGNAIYRDKQFAKAPGVQAAAKRIWGQIADAASKLDETQGSGGALARINKTYKALYGMEDNMIKGTDIRAMTNPQAVGAENRFAQFVKPFEDLDPATRQELAPEMHNYLADTFPKVFAKAKTMVAATGGKGDDMISKLFSMAGLRALKPINVANRAGQLSNLQYNAPSMPSSLQGALDVGSQVPLSSTAPSIAGQSVTRNGSGQ